MWVLSLGSGGEQSALLGKVEPGKLQSVKEDTFI